MDGTSTANCKLKFIKFMPRRHSVRRQDYLVHCMEAYLVIVGTTSGECEARSEATNNTEIIVQRLPERTNFAKALVLEVLKEPCETHIQVGKGRKIAE